MIHSFQLEPIVIEYNDIHYYGYNEYIRWCDDNLTKIIGLFKPYKCSPASNIRYGLNWSDGTRVQLYGKTITFFRKTDATAFKLRWL